MFLDTLVAGERETFKRVACFGKFLPAIFDELCFLYTFWSSLSGKQIRIMSTNLKVVTYRIKLIDFLLTVLSYSAAHTCIKNQNVAFFLYDKMLFV